MSQKKEMGSNEARYNYSINELIEMGRLEDAAKNYRAAMKAMGKNYSKGYCKKMVYRESLRFKKK